MVMHIGSTFSQLKKKAYEKAIPDVSVIAAESMPSKENEICCSINGAALLRATATAHLTVNKAVKKSWSPPPCPAGGNGKVGWGGSEWSSSDVLHGYFFCLTGKTSKTQSHHNQNRITLQGEPNDYRTLNHVGYVRRHLVCISPEGKLIGLIVMHLILHDTAVSVASPEDEIELLLSPGKEILMSLCFNTQQILCLWFYGGVKLYPCIRMPWKVLF